MAWCTALALCLLILQQGLVQPNAGIVEQIVHRAFHTMRELNTLIFWDVSEISLIHALPYPRIVLDNSTAFKDALRENCLVIMELKVTHARDVYNLVNSAFTKCAEHYLAKYVVLLFYDSKIAKTIENVNYYFDYMNIMSYVIVVQYPGKHIRNIVGYMKHNQFIVLNQTADFGIIFNARLHDLPLRAIVTESKPYSYLSKRLSLGGLDIEIAKIVAQKMGVSLSVNYFDSIWYENIPKLLSDKQMDMFLTQRGCNSVLKLPQLRLQEKLNVRMLMPKMQRFSFNLQFLKPYRPEVWYLLLLIISIAGVLNWVFWKRVRVNILMVIIFGYHQETSRLTALLVLVIQFLKFILLEAYLGQVTSFMIRLRYQENPQTLEQFFASDIMLNAPIGLNQFFSLLPTTLSEQLMEKIKLPRMSVTNENDFFQPGYAYIITEYASDALKNEVLEVSIFNSSFFYIMQEPLYELEMCYMFGKWSKFRSKFKECLERMYETGIILKLTDNAWRLPNKALNADSSTVLMFPDLVPVFRFIGYGWLVSVMCLAEERTMQRARILFFMCYDRFERVRFR
uniref:Ionotropic receptor n=1 Tax=Anopheles gambiae TaxID=7165 RepID=A0A499FWZ8_ANOGA